jgi:3-(3-hydroxy-phenyl)propionate hydroxylase
VLRSTMALVALSGTDERTGALRETMAELLSMYEPCKRIAGLLSGLDIHYDLDGDHPLVGRRMPDLDLVTAPSAVLIRPDGHVAWVEDLTALGSPTR